MNIPGVSGGTSLAVLAGDVSLSLNGTQVIGKATGGGLSIGNYVSGQPVTRFVSTGATAALTATGVEVSVAGSFGTPSIRVGASAIGLYLDASGVLGLAGRVLIGDAASGTNELLTLIGGSSGDLVYVAPGGGGYTVADGSLNYTLVHVDPQNANIAKAATPTALDVFSVRLTAPTLVATGASGTARIVTASATLYVTGPPILSGSWTSGGIQHAVNVASGRLQVYDELNVGAYSGGASTFNINRASGTISAFGAGGGGQQASGGTLGGVIAGLVTLGFFSS